jgi:hypothetical protein
MIVYFPLGCLYNGRTLGARKPETGKSQDRFLVNLAQNVTNLDR